MTSLAADDPRHGTRNGYHNHGCRCEPCTKASSAYMKAYQHRSGRHRPREMYLTELRANPPAHGTESRYVDQRCRCDDCKRASRVARARRRSKATA